MSPQYVHIVELMPERTNGAHQIRGQSKLGSSSSDPPCRSGRRSCPDTQKGWRSSIAGLPISYTLDGTTLTLSNDRGLLVLEPATGD